MTNVAFSPTRHRFTVKDYHRMAEAEVFDPDDRVELIDGEVLEMAPIGSRHAACVRRLARLFMTALAEDVAVVSVQDPMGLDDRNEPQPDVAILQPRPDFYAAGHPEPPDVLLAIEVADTTLALDLERKCPLYLRSGVPEVWVVDVNAEVVHGVTAAGKCTVARGETLAPRAFPDVVLEVPAIVG